MADYRSIISHKWSFLGLMAGYLAFLSRFHPYFGANNCDWDLLGQHIFRYKHLIFRRIEFRPSCDPKIFYNEQESLQPLNCARYFAISPEKDHLWRSIAPPHHLKSVVN
jgi:hypothetical protein